MEFISFKEETVKIAENQPEYITLPAHQVGDKNGTTFIKMKLSPEEIEYVNRTGCLYMSVLTFNKPFPPLMVYARNPFPVLQEITPELATIYYADLDAVYFYSVDGEKLLLMLDNSNFTNEWIPSVGFKTFAYFRIEKNLFGKVILQITINKQKGLTTKLNHQFYNRED